MGGKNLRKLAIYYGWPSAVRGLSDDITSIDQAIKIFSQFDIIVFGRGIEMPYDPNGPEHADKKNTEYIARHLSGKEVQGYVYLSDCIDFPAVPDDELVERLEKWKEMGMSGVFFDLVHPEYGASLERIARITDAAHNKGLHVTFNTNFGAVGDWLEERITRNAREGDFVLIEPFGTSWQKESYALPDRLPQEMAELQSMGVGLLGVSTYDTEQITVKTVEGRKVLIKRFLHYKREAERLSLDGYQFTGGVYSAYGAEANLLVDFNALAKSR